MSDNPVSNVNRVELQNVQPAQVQMSQTAVQTLPKDAVSAPKKTAETPKKEATAEATPKPAQKAQIPLISRETNLKFQVDDKTHQVTIMIMDRETNKVITTIPPDKIKDVPPGDLLQYLI